ncbi:MAG: DUF192 domain-containing protein [Spirochaetales bacterium]|nr:DUF192 domain-containing protein [Spirochaetales bacterium]
MICVWGILAVSCAGTSFKKAEVEIAGETFTLEIAYTQEQQQQGLMNRKRLGANEGMLFVYDYDKKMSFWMKNTSIPLSIAYITSEGVVKEIHDLEPYRLSPVNSRHSVRYALELNQGRFSQLGIRPGMKIFDPGTIPLSLLK